MGHYDSCRPGYCGGCGAAPGNIKNGVCEFCDVKPNPKEKTVPVKRIKKEHLEAEKVAALRDKSAMFRALMSAVPVTLSNKEALTAWTKFTSSVHHSIALDRVWRDSTLLFNGTKEHPVVMTESGDDYSHQISVDETGTVADPLKWLDSWAAVVGRTRERYGEPYSIGFDDAYGAEISLKVYRSLTPTEIRENSAKATAKKSSKTYYHLKALRDLLGVDGVRKVLSEAVENLPSMEEVANAPTKLKALKKSTAPKPKTRATTRKTRA